MYVGIMGAIRIAITVIILVFFILSLLALLMVGLREIVKMTSKKQTEDKKITVSEKEKAITKLPIKEKDQEKEKEHDEKIIAAISAAVSSFLERPMRQIKIINIVRNVPPGVSPWTISGKQNMMSDRISISSRKRGGF